MSKNHVLMRDVICLYHPEFKSSSDLRTCGMKYPELFNIERLIEESLAAVGPYSFVNQSGYDFSDFSDSKTVTVNANSRYAEITGVENKIGALRITAYNPFTQSVDFFYVPKSKMSFVKLPCYGKNSHKERLRFSYCLDRTYGYMEQLRESNFINLATNMKP